MNLAERIENADILMEKVKSKHTAISMQKTALISQTEDITETITVSKEDERKYLLAVEQLRI